MWIDGLLHPGNEWREKALAVASAARRQPGLWRQQGQRQRRDGRRRVARRQLMPRDSVVRGARPATPQMVPGRRRGGARVLPKPLRSANGPSRHPPGRDEKPTSTAITATGAQREARARAAAAVCGGASWPSGVQLVGVPLAIENQRNGYDDEDEEDEEQDEVFGDAVDMIETVGFNSDDSDEDAEAGAAAAAARSRRSPRSRRWAAATWRTCSRRMRTTTTCHAPPPRVAAQQRPARRLAASVIGVAGRRDVRPRRSPHRWQAARARSPRPPTAQGDGMHWLNCPSRRSPTAPVGRGARAGAAQPEYDLEADEADDGLQQPEGATMAPPPPQYCEDGSWSSWDEPSAREDDFAHGGRVGAEEAPIEYGYEEEPRNSGGVSPTRRSRRRTFDEEAEGDARRRVGQPEGDEPPRGEDGGYDLNALRRRRDRGGRRDRWRAG